MRQLQSFAAARTIGCCAGQTSLTRVQHNPPRWRRHDTVLPAALQRDFPKAVAQARSNASDRNPSFAAHAQGVRVAGQTSPTRVQHNPPRWRRHDTVLPAALQRDFPKAVVQARSNASDRNLSFAARARGVRVAGLSSPWLNARFRRRNGASGHPLIRDPSAGVRQRADTGPPLLAEPFYTPRKRANSSYRDFKP